MQCVIGGGDRRRRRLRVRDCAANVHVVSGVGADLGGDARGGAEFDDRAVLRDLSRDAGVEARSGSGVEGGVAMTAPTFERTCWWRWTRCARARCARADHPGHRHRRHHRDFGGRDHRRAERLDPEQGAAFGSQYVLHLAYPRGPAIRPDAGEDPNAQVFRGRRTRSSSEETCPGDRLSSPPSARAHHLRRAATRFATGTNSWSGSSCAACSPSTPTRAAVLRGDRAASSRDSTRSTPATSS